MYRMQIYTVGVVDMVKLALNHRSQCFKSAFTGLPFEMLVLKARRGPVLAKNATR